MIRRKPDPSARDLDPQAESQRQLAEALFRARLAIAWERLWPIFARLLTVAGLFVAVSWAGAWVSLPFVARAICFAAFVITGVAVVLPLVRFRWPTRVDALARLDRGVGLPHRPATALSDTLASQDPLTQALWQAQRARTLASVKRIRAGLPSPRLALHDPWALRGLVAIMLVATFVAAGGERTSRILSAFDWDGAFSSAATRIDVWITPPPYTGRSPIILTAAVNKDAAKDSGKNASRSDNGTISVPVGSTLIARSSGGNPDVDVSGGVSEVPVTDKIPQGSGERHFTIGGDGTARVRSSGLPQWTFKAIPDHAPSISLTKDPERQARGALQLVYKLEDDYGVTEAHADFALRAPAAPDNGPAQPLYDAPTFPLGLPNARTRNGVGQTVKDLSDHPFAGSDVTLTLVAKDEAGNEGRSEVYQTRLPERLFLKPLPRALIEQRRNLALDANQKPLVMVALQALMIAPEAFMPELGNYLGLRSVADQLERANTKDGLRETVDSLWALAVAIEDANTSDAEKALRAAQDALKQALERGASDEEIKKLTDNLKAALDNFMRQLADQMKNNPQQLARPLDPNAKTLRPQDLKSMIDRMERLSRSGDKEAARELLDQMQQMLENLQMAQPGQGGENEGQQALNELSDLARKQQQLRDKTFKQGQDSRRDRSRGQQGDQNALNDLQQDQQNLRNRLQKLLDSMKKNGMGGQQPKGPQGQGEDGQQDDGGNALGDADSAMGDADGQLGDGNADSAVDSQGRALDALKKGAQSLAQSMQQGDEPGEGSGNRPGRQKNSAEQTDPLGRPLRGREYSDDLTVKIPGEIDVQRVRRILEELRRRFADPQRPQIELDYIERLLKDY